MHKLTFKKSIIKFLLLALFLFPLFASASATTGTIDPSHNLAWGENLAWINFSANNDVTVTDSALTGNIWSQTYGWISLNPTSQYNVINDGNGNLSGYAWGQNVGWINFSGAIINSSGKFTGTIGDPTTTAGRISFDCASCDVETDWRPASERGPHGSGSLITNVPPVATTPTVNISTVTPTTPPPTITPTTTPTNIITTPPSAPLLSQGGEESSHPKVGGVPASSEGSGIFKFTLLLKLGSKGNEVKELQKILKLKPDGNFGASTLKALKAFQVKNKIAKPGVAGYGQVGPKTREVLNRVGK
jgi:hypothetical protein